MENGAKNKTYWQFCRWKFLLDEGGHMKMVRLAQAARKDILTQSLQEIISVCTKRQTLR